MKIKHALSLLLCLAGVLAFAQPRSSRMTPIQYNDKLASITDSLYQMGVVWGTEFQKIANSDQDYSRLSASRKKLIAFTSRKIEEVHKTPAVGKGGEALKTAMLDFLNFEKNMINTAFFPLEQYNSSTTKEEMDKAVDHLTTEADKETEALKKVNAAQESFASQNGFEIESADSSGQ